MCAEVTRAALPHQSAAGAGEAAPRSPRERLCVIWPHEMSAWRWKVWWQQPLTFMIGRRTAWSRLSGAAPRKRADTTCCTAAAAVEMRLLSCTCSVTQPSEIISSNRPPSTDSTPHFHPTLPPLPRSSPPLTHQSAFTRRRDTANSCVHTAPAVPPPYCTDSTRLLLNWTFQHAQSCCGVVLFWCHWFEALHQDQVTPDSPEGKAAAWERWGAPKAALLPPCGWNEIWIPTLDHKKHATRSA